MTRFEQVQQILDQAVGGPTASVGAHMAFWRGITRNQFVVKKVFGRQLIVIGNGKGSNLVKALKGESPFGADIGVPGAVLNRMPSGLAPVSAASIAIIEKWIDDGCPDEDIQPAMPLVGAAAATLERTPIARRYPFAMPQHPRIATLAGLMREEKRNLAWIQNALQVAIQLELATLPPYLTAYWTIKSDPAGTASGAFFEIFIEEMSHMGLGCNLLVAVGGTPLIADPKIVPKYPGQLPGGVRPHLTVGLRKLDKPQLADFMEIEYPATGPVLLSATASKTIGEFYAGILAAFQTNNPTLSLDRQLENSVANIFKLDTLAKVEQAIALIVRQGEGTSTSPEEGPGDLAHFYRFGELYTGKRFVPDASGKWGYFGDSITLPEVHDMADIPAGGYQQADVPDLATWELITRFDKQYSDLLRELQNAWTHGDDGLLEGAIAMMGPLQRTGKNLVVKPKPDGRGNYGPCFRFVP